MNLIALLRQQAKEIADAGHNGWGNTMIEAADEIEKLNALKPIDERFGTQCAKCGKFYPLIKLEWTNDQWQCKTPCS